MSNPMTDTIEELERLLAGYGRKEVSDIELWDALKDAAPSLLASLKAVTAERDAMAEALKKIAGADMGEGGCYYTNRTNISIARKALESSK